MVMVVVDHIYNIDLCSVLIKWISGSSTCIWA